MYNYNPLDCLPSSAELRDSDDIPVDNELQILIPNLLLAILASIWQTRDDWFFWYQHGNLLYTITTCYSPRWVFEFRC